MVVSLECDVAVRLLMVTLAQYRRSEAALAGQAPIRGRLAVLPPDSVNSRVRRESLLVRSVSIMESYVHGQLVARLAPLAPIPRTDLMERLYADFEERGITSWVETDKYFKEHVHKSVKIRSYLHWNRVNAVIEARNAVVHGLGRFTSRQVRRGVPAKVAKDLKALSFDVVTSSDRVRVTPSAVEQVPKLLRGYLEWLDGVLAAMP